MLRLVLASACVPIVLLGGCAGTSRQPAAGSPRAADSAYGMFLAGTAALNDGRNSEASRFLDQARTQGGDDPAVTERAFSAALMAGDIERAAMLAPDGPTASDQGKRLGRLTKLVAAVADGKGKQAREILGTDGIGFPHRGAVALLSPWIAAMVGDAEGSVVRPTLRGDGGVDYFGQIGQGHLFERARRFDEAETDFKAVTSGDQPAELAVMAYGGFLERRGRKADAVALYDAALKRNAFNAALKAARTRAAAGRTPPPAPTIKEGAAFALLAPAATLISAKNTPVGLAYLRLALKLDPNRNDGWLMLGDVLQQAGDVEGARAAYLKPKPNAAEFPAAQAKLAWSYQSVGDKVEALRLAKVGAATGDTDARLTLADLLAANERHDEAIALWNALIAEDKTPSWQLYYARARSLEKVGRWKDAEADLIAALAQRPEEPELLNYLGYAWIDRSERLPEAMAMVERAVAANPRSGAVVDSLGWAHFRQGDFKKAVELLEQAVELEAGDPEINNHLGDAYWMTGRKDEAGFQWRRVLTLQPDDKIKADAEKKIASGLGPAPKLAGQ